MVYGIGVDCVQVARMETSLAHPRFVQRVFAPEEQRLIAEKSAAAARQTAAANFAAKEAFLKAAGKGLGGFCLKDIAALRRESGQPYLALGGAAQAFCREKGLTAHLSLSHDGGMATAIVMLEKREPAPTDDAVYYGFSSGR